MQSPYSLWWFVVLCAVCFFSQLYTNLKFKPFRLSSTLSSLWQPINYLWFARRKFCLVFLITCSLDSVVAVVLVEIWFDIANVVLIYIPWLSCHWVQNTAKKNHRNREKRAHKQEFCLINCGVKCCWRGAFIAVRNLLHNDH